MKQECDELKKLFDQGIMVVKTKFNVVEKN